MQMKNNNKSLNICNLQENIKKFKTYLVLLMVLKKKLNLDQLHW
jgi:hypothetical protein